MQQDNVEFVQNNVKYMGFGDKLNDQIAKNIQQGFPEFTLKTESVFNQKKIEGELYFRKSDSTDRYFFNRYNAELKDDANNINRAQTFYLDKGNGVTFKEAFNLLQGRAVHKELSNKEGEKYNAWVQLDFDNKDKHNNYKVKSFTDNYGYDLDKAVRAFPIRELDKENEQKILMNSLLKGNVQSVTVMKDGGTEKIFIEANPQWKTINLYDDQMKPLNKEQKQGYMIARPESPAEKHSAGQANGQEEKQTAKQDKSFKNTNNESNGLLPKKKDRSHKKGMSVT